jgi:hypothetical protein
MEFSAHTHEHRMGGNHLAHAASDAIKAVLAQLATTSA